MAALALDGIGHRFGPRAALEDVSFTLAPGTFTVLLGENGAGKTTLFNLVTRLYDCRIGTIRIFGRALKAEPARALADLGVVFQARTVDMDLSLTQNLSYHAALHGIGRRETRARVAEALAQIGLAERGRETIRKLSGGQLRRVEIARALLHRPRLLLLDEPTVGLDVPSRAALIAHVRDLVQQRGLAVLWATHLIDEVAADDRLVVLHKGRVMAQGTVPQVLAQTRATDVLGAFRTLTAPGKAAA